MIEKSDAASIFQATQGSRSIEISVPGTFTAVGFSGQQKNPGASAAERGRPSVFKTIDEDRRAGHDHINRSGRPLIPKRFLSEQAEPPLTATVVGDTVPIVMNRFGAPDYIESPLRFSQPDFCARPEEKCRDDYAIRLWYQLPFTFVVGGHVLVIDFDDRQHVINKLEMRSP